jgi:prolipoprotein diacylglyceryl transferase
MDAMTWNSVVFPGLGGLRFELSATALAIGPLDIKWYGVIIGAGVILAMLLLRHYATPFGITEDNIFDYMILAIPAGILGARGYYILFYLDLFRKADGSLDFLQMIRTRDGGLAIYGAVILCALLLFVFCKVKGIRFLAFADLMVFGLLLGQALGRWGNFFNIEAYGAETALPWRMGILDRFTGLYAEVHPTFFYEFLWNVLGMVVLALILRRFHKFDGISCCGYFIWYGLGRFWIEGLRADSLYFFGSGIRVSQAFAALSALVAAAVLFGLYRQYKTKPVPMYRDTIQPKTDDKEDTADGDNH